ncbi:hypothetical protein JTS96_15370 [Clostridium botulinum]|nr:hypothetical protein [Clostridium botulinum]
MESKKYTNNNRKAMVIRFKSEAVNPMGKMASGVTGISLKDLDKVILASIIDENDTRKIKIKTKAKDKGTIEINKIKVQNRAGIGNSLMPLLLNDFVEVVELKK